MIKTVVFIGAGNVAYHLAQAINRSDFEVLQVFSRTHLSAKGVGEKINCPYTNNKNEIIKNADLYICSVSDDNIIDALSDINFTPNSIIVHTAGSVNMNILNQFSEQVGVLYPMQTFSKNKEIDFNKLSIYLEASNDETYKELYNFAIQISPNIKQLNSENRLKLHTAAVFACNFTNHLYRLSADIMQESGLEFSELLPLIDETCNKVHYLSPSEAQTGPAIRRDEKIIQKHLNSLDENKKVIYSLLSKSIQYEKL